MAKNKNPENLKSFSEVFGDGEFYPDLPKIPFRELLDKELILYEVKILKDFNSKFGRHDCGLMLMSAVGESEKFTTICSGQVVLERLRKSVDMLPLLCTPVEKKTADGDSSYYNLL